MNDAALMVLIKPLCKQAAFSNGALLTSKAVSPLSSVDIVLTVQTLASFDGWKGDGSQERNAC